MKYVLYHANRSDDSEKLNILRIICEMLIDALVCANVSYLKLKANSKIAIWMLVFIIRE